VSLFSQRHGEEGSDRGFDCLDYQPRVGPLANAVFGRHVLCVVGYSYQLYFDFSGYSDMALGLGTMFGIRLPQNFVSPYKAVDIADF